MTGMAGGSGSPGRSRANMPRWEASTITRLGATGKAQGLQGHGPVPQTVLHPGPPGLEPLL